MLGIAERFVALLPDDRKRRAHFKFWCGDDGKWRASVSAASGGVGGSGGTPESAVSCAVDHWEQGEKRR
jgi:hypothetical protein